MLRTWGRVSLFALLASFCMLTVAAEKKSTGSSKASTANTKAESSTKQGETTKGAQRAGRLPRHFASLVDDKQRAEIYEIQVSYREKMQELEAALVKLEEAQQSDMEKVLTSTQRKKLDELRKNAGSGSSPKSAANSKGASPEVVSAKGVSAKTSPTKTASATKSRKKTSAK